MDIFLKLDLYHYEIITLIYNKYVNNIFTNLIKINQSK